ncbi:Homeobox-leucine zipper protein HAT3 [Acorus gramineus]|uniref:Homeobox-leucine zipper protein HAT3 n=1 Tax=Acorus gramineus TaxID=55184 RepID=A0AAV9ACP2_ACOGR|nr:Homeobox-leucine zipper protein HAT3 [Acorus gramineus]
MELALPVCGGRCSFLRSTRENVERESKDHPSLQLELKLSWSNELDVNAVPPKIDRDGEASRSSSTNHALTDAEAEKGSCKCSEDDDEGGGGATKTRQKKLRLSKEQSCYLEDSFKEHTTLNPLQKQKNAIAKQLNLRPRQVEVWFQNRRARTKLRQTELDYECLKQRCENLTTENQRLRQELQGLRALRVPTHRANAPPTALYVCPSCEKATPTTGDDGKRLGGYLGFPMRLKRQLC